MLDIAGIPPPAKLNGSSWACLASRDPTGATCGPAGGPWRRTLDLEHSTIFNDTNHWNALVTEEGLKYIFQATDGEEQLFNLTEDPHEMRNVAGEGGYAAPLAALRAALGAQWVGEGRGKGWVDGMGLPVARGAAGQVYSPNFPTPSPCPKPPPIPVPCGSFYATQGGYYKSCGGEAGNRGSFAGLTKEEAMAKCCADPGCSGLDFAVGAGGKGGGFFKNNALGWWTDSAVYVGFYKPGQAPGH